MWESSGGIDCGGFGVRNVDARVAWSAGVAKAGMPFGGVRVAPCGSACACGTVLTLSLRLGLGSGISGAGVIGILRPSEFSKSLNFAGFLSFLFLFWFLGFCGVSGCA